MMSDGWATIAQMIGLRDQRKQARKDRTSQNIENMASMLYGSKEAERGREHDIGMAETQHGFTMDELKARLKGEGALAGEQAGYRQEEIGAEAGFRAEETELARTYQLKAEDQRQDFELRLQGIQNADDLARVDQQYKNALKAAEAESKLGRTLYPEGPMTFTVGGRVYEYESDHEYEVELRRADSDLINDRIRLEAALRAEGVDTGEYDLMTVFDYEFAKVQAANPDLWQPGQGWMVTVDEETESRLMAEMESALRIRASAGDIGEEHIEGLLSYFALRLKDAVAEVDADEGRPSLTNIPLGEGTVAAGVQELGFPGRAAAPLVTLGERVFPNLYPQTTEVEREETGMPEGVLAADLTHARRGEMEPWKQLTELIKQFTTSGSQEDRQQAIDYRTMLEKPGHARVNEIRTIQDFIEQFMQSQSAAPQGDQLSYVRNMLRGV